MTRLPNFSLQLRLPVAEAIRACEHPSAFETTALGEVPDRMMCNGCGAVWTTPRHGLRWERGDLPTHAEAPDREPDEPIPGFREYQRRHALMVGMDPDPRGTLRPGWLADDEAWRDQLRAMDSDTRHWIEKHWDMAGGKGPAVDMSWVTTEEIGGGRVWPFLVVVVLLVVLLTAPIALVAR